MKINLDMLKKEQQNKTTTKSDVKWGKLGERTLLKILPPWRKEEDGGGLPWFSIGQHYDKNTKKSVFCSNSVPEYMLPKGVKPIKCKICEEIKNESSFGPSRTRHFVNAIIITEDKTSDKEVMVIGLPNTVKDDLLFLLEDTEESAKIFCDMDSTDGILVKKTGTGLETKYKTKVTPIKMKEMGLKDFSGFHPYNLDEIFLGALTSEKYQQKALDAEKKNKKGEEDFGELPTIKKPEEKKKDIPSCFGNYGSISKGICIKCPVELPCKMNVSEKNKEEEE